MFLTKKMPFILFTAFISFSALLVSNQELPIMSEESIDDEWRKFAVIGGGYFKMPEKLRAHEREALDFAKNISLSPDQKTTKEKEVQLEFAFINEKDWSKELPGNVANMALSMNDIAVFVLNKVLDALSFPKVWTPLATGGMSTGKGDSNLKAAFYDASRELPGFGLHKDIRIVTIILFEDPGLQCFIGETLVEVTPKEGYFFVNLGVLFEALINDPSKLIALPHQVRQVTKNRSSFGVFSQGRFNEPGFYQLENSELVWQAAEKIDQYLIKKDSHLFSKAAAHRIFSQFDPN